MNEDQIDGSVKSGLGKAQSRLGGLFGDARMQGRGDAGQVEGSIQEIYGRARDHAGKVVDDATQRLTDQPFQVLGAVAAASFFLGLFLGRARTKIVYVRK